MDKHFHHVGIDVATPVADVTDGAAYDIGLGDVLQQVSPASPAVGEKGQRSRDVEVLAEQEQTRVGMVFAQPAGGLDPLVGAGSGASAGR